MDSNDREREELMRMLAEDDFRDAFLLVFANKPDLPNAMNAAEITDKLGGAALSTPQELVHSGHLPYQWGWFYRGPDWLSNQSGSRSEPDPSPVSSFFSALSYLLMLQV